VIRGTDIRPPALALIVMIGFALAACGSSDGGDSSGRATAVSGVPDGAAFIDQDNLRFSPNSLELSAPELVYFKNSETTVHTVTINGENESGTMERDEVFTWTPPGEGEYKITCDFHPQMKATITVGGTGS
jgi:plastocyanin